MALVNILNGPEEEHTLFNADISWLLSNFEATQNWNFTVIFDFDVETATKNDQLMLKNLQLKKKKMSDIWIKLIFWLKLALGLNQVFNFGPLL